MPELNATVSDSELIIKSEFKFAPTVDSIYGSDFTTYGEARGYFSKKSSGIRLKLAFFSSIKNAGASCYANSALQVLISISGMTEALQCFTASYPNAALPTVRRYLDVVDFKCKESDEDMLMKAVENLIYTMRSLKPKYLRWLSPLSQSDSGEFLCELLTLMGSESEEAVLRALKTNPGQTNPIYDFFYGHYNCHRYDSLLWCLASAFSCSLNLIFCFEIYFN